jgi:hypothetical protein
MFNYNCLAKDFDEWIYKLLSASLQRKNYGTIQQLPDRPE